MKETIVILEVGSSNISMTYSEINRKNELAILGNVNIASSGVYRGSVVNIDLVSKDLYAAKCSLEKFVGNKIEDVYLLLSGSICTVHKNKAMVAISAENREIKENDVNRALDMVKCISLGENDVIIELDPYQFLVDGIKKVKDPVGMIGDRIEVDSNLIVSNTADMANVLKVVQNAKLNLCRTLIQPLCISAEILNNQNVNYVTAIVDVGGEVTTISIFKGNVLEQIYKFDLGGKNITKDIAYYFNLPFNKAEELKKEEIDFSRAYADNENIITENSFNEKININKSLFNNIAYDRVEEILLNVKIQLEKYDDQVNAVIIIGGGIGDFKGISEITKYNLKIPCKVYKEKIFEEEKSIFAPAVSAIREQYYYTLNKKTKLVDEEVNEKEGILNKIRGFIDDFL